MADSSHYHKLFFLLCVIFFSNTCVHSSNASIRVEVDLSSLCATTPYPTLCLRSLNVSVGTSPNPNINNYLIQSLQTAASETTKLINLFNNVGRPNIVDKKRGGGGLRDCRELHQSSLASLEESISGIRSSDMDTTDVAIYLSAVLTNKNTCLEGLDSATGTMKPVLVKAVMNTYMHASNSLAILSNPAMGTDPENNPLKGEPMWLTSTDQSFFGDSPGDEYDPKEKIVVAADGTGAFRTITEAINYAPVNSMERTVIYVKEGTYEENVEIPFNRTNIVMIGDGSDATVITGNRSVGDGWSTFRSATLAVNGKGFLARDIAFKNSAGPKSQAVALRVSADLAAFYRCKMDGYQDTLYVHSFRQFYRECDISGTIDFIFGNAQVVLQECNIISREPLHGQATVITAQSRDDPNDPSGIVIQQCKIKASFDNSSVKSYLGRPWRNYSRTVYLESTIDEFIDPKGWTEWDNDKKTLDTLYYGEYDNEGLGSSTDKRVNWSGYHVMTYDDAFNFTVSHFIKGDWLQLTLFPFELGI